MLAMPSPPLPCCLTAWRKLSTDFLQLPLDGLPDDGGLSGLSLLGAGDDPGGKVGCVAYDNVWTPAEVVAVRILSWSSHGRHV